MENKKNKFLTGFTIIELVVVMAVFLFIIGAAISIFISIIQHQKRVLAEQELIDQLSYGLEHMSKALRTARAAVTPSDIKCMGEDNAGYIYLLRHYDKATSLYKGIRFINQSDVDPDGNPICEEFFFDESSGKIKEIKNDKEATDLTSSKLEIEYVKFAINGSDGTSTGCPNEEQCGAAKQDPEPNQPRVTIIIKAKTALDGQEPMRTFQTTVSERNLNARY